MKREKRKYNKINMDYWINEISIKRRKETVEDDTEPAEDSENRNSAEDEHACSSS